MKYVIGVALVAVGGLLFVVGWWIGSVRSIPPATAPPKMIQESNHELKKLVAQKDEQLKLMNREAASLRRDLAIQRQMIREHQLKQTSRSIDEMLALFPAKFPAGNWKPAETVFEDCWFPSVDGIRLHGWLLRHKSPQVAILYAHGNAGNVAGRARVAHRLHEQFRASVFIFDYRGYGRSEGVPTVEGLTHDTRAARDFLAQRESIKPTDVVLLGRSLGAALATQLASEEGARGLILQSPFASLKQAAAGHYPGWMVDLLVADRLNSHENIANYRGPLLVSHGTSDRTIAFEQGVELFEAANEPKTFFRIVGGDHNSPLPESYYARLGNFLNDLPNQQSTQN